MAFSIVSASFFIERNVIYDSNMWIPTFFFSVLYYKNFIIFSSASKNKPKISSKMKIKSNYILVQRLKI